MHDRPNVLTLAGLQRLLDGLRPGEHLSLTLSESQRLFGENDAGRGRMEHFARGHHCTVAEGPFSLTFSKR